MNSHRAMITGFVISAGIITWQEIHSCHTFPWPPRYVGAGIVFGLLDLTSPFISPELAGIVGFGFILAMIINGTLDPRKAANCDHGGTPQPASIIALTQQQANANTPGTTPPTLV